MTFFKKFVIIWTSIAWLFWLLVNLATNEETGLSNFSFTIFYYLIWIFIIGGLLWKFNKPISSFLQKLPIPKFWKVLALGYLAIITEEIIAGTTNAINESWALPHIWLRIHQFELFNWFTFTGFILGWAILLGKVKFGRKELFIMAGLWGFFAEHQIYLIGNPLVFLSLGTLTFMTYGVIMTPMMLAVNEDSGIKIFLPLRWLLGYGFCFILSILPIFILQKLILQHPEWFPPDNLVA